MKKVVNVRNKLETPYSIPILLGEQCSSNALVDMFYIKIFGQHKQRTPYYCQQLSLLTQHSPEHSKERIQFFIVKKLDNNMIIHANIQLIKYFNIKNIFIFFALF